MRYRYLVLLLLVVVIITPTVSSCGFPWDASDPVSNTSGYRLFTGKDEGFRVSFEYPDTWRRKGIEKYDSSIGVRLILSDTSSIHVSSYMSSNGGGDYENAGELIPDLLNIYSERPEFQVLSYTTVRLGQVEGEEVIYSYRFIVESDPHLSPETVIDKMVIGIILAADYKGRIYDIGLGVDDDEYENVRADYEHLIDTFQFLD